ncbi:MAG: hypothetical protein IT162_14080 [Bryobacterales bacterium]|nr:hypothetical protein [Bryobacterales bacterium]
MQSIESGVTGSEKLEALNRLLRSQTLARADQLRRFLRYVCEAEMAGRAGAITEHTIATEALGRSADYVPGDDSSVRNRAHALRQKLEEYYRNEDPSAAVRVELRRGSYAPVFLRAAAKSLPLAPALAPVAEPVVAEPPPAEARPESSPALPARRPFWLWLLAGVAAGAIVASMVHRWTSPPTRNIDPSLRMAWGTMLEPGADVTICIASPPVLLLKSFRDGTRPSQSTLLPAPEAVSQWYAGLGMLDGGGRLYMNSTMASSLTGDALAAVRGVRLLTEAGAKAQVIPEWGARPLALQGRNLLVIGSPNYSPLAARALRSMPYTVWYDPALKEEVIAEDLADGKAKRVFQPRRDVQGLYAQVYGLLTVLPSPGRGDRHAKLAIFSGITAAGPQAAMEYFASPTHMKALAGRLGNAGALPEAYQVVVRTSVDRSLALDWGYEAHRVADPVRLLE